MGVPGITRFQLIDEDGDELPGAREFAWEGRDPFDLVVAAIAEVSERPWRWASRRVDARTLSPQQCRVIAVRVRNVLRRSHRAQLVASVARLVREEFEPRTRRPLDAVAIERMLEGDGDELDARPELVAAAMLRSLRETLEAAVECDAGLMVSWQVG